MGDHLIYGELPSFILLPWTRYVDSPFRGLHQQLSSCVSFQLCYENCFLEQVGGRAAGAAAAAAAAARQQLGRPAGAQSAIRLSEPGLESRAGFPRPASGPVPVKGLGLGSRAVRARGRPPGRKSGTGKGAGPSAPSPSCPPPPPGRRRPEAAFRATCDPTYPEPEPGPQTRRAPRLGEATRRRHGGGERSDSWARPPVEVGAFAQGESARLGPSRRAILGIQRGSSSPSLFPPPFSLSSEAAQGANGRSAPARAVATPPLSGPARHSARARRPARVTQPGARARTAHGCELGSPILPPLTPPDPARPLSTPMSPSRPPPPRGYGGGPARRAP